MLAPRGLPGFHGRQSRLQGDESRVSDEGNGWGVRQAMAGGFTLTEVLVVIAIIVVLAAVGFPLVSRMRESSQAITCTRNLRTLQIQTMLYALDNYNSFPLTNSPKNNYALELATNGYLGLSGDTKEQRTKSWIDLSKRQAPFVLWCPAAEACEPRRNNLATYGMNMFVGGDGGGWRSPGVSAVKTHQIDTPSRTALFMDGCFRPGIGYSVQVGESGFMPTPMHPPSRYKKTRNPSGSVNVVFVDGHVESRQIGTIPTDFKQPFWAERNTP